MQIVITLNSYEELEELQGNLARILSGNKTQTDPAPAPAPKKEKAPAKKAEPEPAVDPDPEPAEPKEGIAESAVKLLLAEKIKSGKKAEIRALFEEYGVSKLSELVSKHPEKLAEFATKAEAV